ncbi:uncharacterized protein LOC134189782 [Corticium candelabrum]|uniref:uncharacterized protein LOC134189782 n=1 Tax=Corticium candelabrum TaxID=121492 RepID=UPI002E264D45|nr:uncharacterized protein LOC134189782 [Corticium candelabrum]
MRIQQFLFRSVLLALCSQLAPAEELSLKSSWLVSNPRKEINQPMGMTFMTCTWISSSQSFANCKSSDVSYGGVTNFDVDNKFFFFDDYFLAIPYKTPFPEPPYCRITQHFLTRNTRVTNMGGFSAETSLALMRSENNQGVKWSVTNSAYNVRVSVYCFAAMPAHGYLLEDKSTNVGVSLPSAWLFIEPVADSTAALGISFVQLARWDNIAGTVTIDDELPSTYGSVANMRLFLAKIEIINGHEMLYIPFTTTYGKPPLCMAQSYDYAGYMPTMPSANGVFLTRYYDSIYYDWSGGNDRITVFCIGAMQYQDLSANSSQYSKTASIPYVGLPSHWTVVNWDYDGNLPMGASLLACTWGTTNKKSIDCDSKQSYGGVANMDLQKAELEESGDILKVPFVKSYAKLPHCFIGENQLEDQFVVPHLIVSMTTDSVSIHGVLGRSYVPWNWSNSTIGSSFTVLCFGVMSWNS